MSTCNYMLRQFADSMRSFSDSLEAAANMADGDGPHCAGGITDTDRLRFALMYPSTALAISSDLCSTSEPAAMAAFRAAIDCHIWDERAHEPRQGAST